MKLWVTPWAVPVPANTTVIGLYGASICFVAYSPMWDQWYLVSGGREEKLDEAPAFWFCSPEWAASNRIPNAVEPLRLGKAPGVVPRRKKGGKQLALQLQ